MQLFRFCGTHGWVTKDLTQDVHKRRVMHAERKQLSGPELVAFLDVPADPRDRAVIAMGVNTGLRSSEITGIKIRDLDFDQREFYVVRTKSYRDARVAMTRSLERELRTWLTYYANNIESGNVLPRVRPSGRQPC